MTGLLVEGIIFLLLAGLATGRVRARTSEWLLAFALLYLALSSQRHVPLFVLAAAPLMARCAQALLGLASSLLPAADRPAQSQVAALRWKPALPAGHTVTLGAINLALLIIVGTGMIAYRAVPNLRPEAQAASIKAALPVQAADALARTGRPLRVFNYYDYGGYLLWRLYPDGGRVYIDGRVEVYGPQVFSRYLRVSSGCCAPSTTSHRWCASCVGSSATARRSACWSSCAPSRHCPTSRRATPSPAATRWPRCSSE